MPENDSRKSPTPQKSTVPALDERSESMFRAIGCDPDSEELRLVFASFKRRKDMIQPGPLSPEGYAFVALVSDMLSGKFTKE